MEKDQVRGNDSLVTFEEILQIAKDKNVSLDIGSCLKMNLSQYSVKISDKYVQHSIIPTFKWLASMNKDLIDVHFLWEFYS